MVILGGVAVVIGGLIGLASKFRLTAAVTLLGSILALSAGLVVWSKMGSGDTGLLLTYYSMPGMEPSARHSWDLQCCCFQSVQL